MGFPPFLLSVREYCAHDQVEAINNTAGTLDSTKPIITVKFIILLSINPYYMEVFILNMSQGVYYVLHKGCYPLHN